MRNKIDQMTYLPTENAVTGNRLQAARSNEKYPPQPAGHQFQSKYVNITDLSNRRTSSTQDLSGKQQVGPTNGFGSNRRPMGN
jgi:hypothetical protein